MRKLLLLGAVLFGLGTALFVSGWPEVAQGRLHHFSVAVAAGEDGTVRIVKTAARSPQFLFPAYLPEGTVYQAPFRSAAGRLDLDFTFWDAGRYELQVAVPGQPTLVQAVEVWPPAAQWARMAGFAALLVALGVLAGYVSYTLPRPGIAALAVLTLLTVTLRPGTVAAHGPARAPAGAPAATADSAPAAVTVAGSPQAYGTATLTFALPPGRQNVDLTFRHAEDDLDLVHSHFQADGQSQFTYTFPEGAPYAVELTATPAGGGTPVEYRQVLDVTPVHPGTWELWRGWLVAVGFFLLGGVVGLRLGNNGTRRQRLMHQEVALQ